MGVSFIIFFREEKSTPQYDVPKYRKICYLPGTYLVCMHQAPRSEIQVYVGRASNSRL